MTSSVRVACCQLAPDVERPAANPELVRDAMAAAIDDGAQIVVVPELANSGYVLSSRGEARASAVGADSELLQGWAREAARGDAVVIGGFCELGADDVVYNSAAVVDGAGVLAIYRKLHLWGSEPRWFAPGAQPAPVVDTRHGRIGIGVCYDIEFPELTRGLALAGAELIALPANWPHDPEPPDGRPALHLLAASTAYLSKVFVAVCDRCGAERGLEFEGASVIAGPDGALRAGPVADRGPRTIVADVPLADARDKRNGPHNDAFGDRRPDHYADELARPPAR